VSLRLITVAEFVPGPPRTLGDFLRPGARRVPWPRGRRHHLDAHAID
jgi:hypothetical protein